MTIEEIKELIRVVHETGIAELEVQRGDNRVRIRSAAPMAQEHVTSPTPLSTPVPPMVSASPTTESKVHQLPARMDDDRDEIIKSPIVGTYYDSPTPESGPYIKVGDRVAAKQVLCIIESMKLMNEIESEIAGTIITKHIENGRPVEYGEALFTIRPV
jgi:acetyl-CoA carboxylase biotin carboxyl carrier protein